MRDDDTLPVGRRRNEVERRRKGAASRTSKTLPGIVNRKRRRSIKFYSPYLRGGHCLQLTNDFSKRLARQLVYNFKLMIN